MTRRSTLSLIGTGSCLGLALWAAAAPVRELSPALQAFQQRDFKKVIHLAEPLAAKGDSDAQLLMGMTYFVGPEGGLPTSDFNAASKWFLRARERKNPEAAFAYALLLRMAGDEAPKDALADGIIRAALLGSPGAQEMLGERLLTGFATIPRDDEEGERYIRLAADAGNPNAYYLLGLAFEKGRLSRYPELIESYKWFWLAAHAPIVEPLENPLSPSKWWRKKEAERWRLKLDEVGSKLNQAQIEEGRHRAAAFLHPAPRPNAAN